MVRRFTKVRIVVPKRYALVAACIGEMAREKHSGMEGRTFRVASRLGRASPSWKNRALAIVDRGSSGDLFGGCRVVGLERRAS